MITATIVADQSFLFLVLLQNQQGLRDGCEEDTGPSKFGTRCCCAVFSSNDSSLSIEEQVRLTLARRSWSRVAKQNDIFCRKEILFVGTHCDRNQGIGSAFGLWWYLMDARFLLP